MSHDHEQHDENEHIPGTGAPEELAMCPVMHIPVNMKDAETKGHMREYNGKKYYFCCANCTAQFDANPEAYADKE